MGLKALVITPTTGAPELIDAINSITTQTYENVDHLIVVDGNNFTDRVNKTLNDERIISGSKLIRVDLPYNTGGNGYYGHRVMAAFSHLVNHDVVLFLDQDNWFESDHVETMVKEIEKFNFDWVYSLRKIFDKDKKYLLDDNCESLGRWPVWVNENAYLIDSSSYCFKTQFLRAVGHIWDYGWGADRRFYTIVKDQIQHKNYGCTGKHSLCYRLGGNEGSVQKEFFTEGNQKTLEKYKGKLPWLDQFL